MSMDANDMLCHSALPTIALPKGKGGWQISYDVLWVLDLPHLHLS